MIIIRKALPAEMKRKLKSIRDKFYPPAQVNMPYEIRISDVGELKEQIAIVTGGSGTIGRSVACHLAAESASVYVCGTRLERVESVVAEIEKLGGKAYPQLLDVTNEKDISTVFAEIFKRHGKLDIMVHCAGGSAREEHAPISELKTSVIDSVLNINLRGAILCCREAAKIMTPQNYGRIINISSVLGTQGKANFSEYAASKGGVISFTRSIAMELGQFGITANCVSPGIVQRGAVNTDQIKRLKQTNWMNDYGKPDDIGGMVRYLVSSQASFLTGQNIIVDGGRSLGLKGD